VAAEIADAAARTGRSTAFIVRRALGAAGAAQLVPSGARAPLSIEPDEDDPADLLTKIKAYGGEGRSLDDAVAAAWTATRARFQSFLARLEDAAKAEQADELDTSLRDAANPAISPERVTALSTSEYPKVRALVAEHPKASAEVLARLAEDREPYVREAVTKRRAR
jgi:hypothetical protein